MRRWSALFVVTAFVLSGCGAPAEPPEEAAPGELPPASEVTEPDTEDAPAPLAWPSALSTVPYPDASWIAPSVPTAAPDPEVPDPEAPDVTTEAPGSDAAEEQEATGPEPPPAPAPEPTPTPEPEPTEPAPTDPEPAPPPAPDPPPPPPPPPPPSPPTPTLPASLVGKEWTTIPTSQKVVALTFDAGANGDAVPSILRTLRDTGTPATFFLTGRFVESFPTYAGQIAAAHPVGNHSYDHPEFTGLSDAAIRTQLATTERLISGVTGRTTKPWFRFPYGDRDGRTIALVNGEGYGSIRWSVDTLGWQGTSGGMTVDKVVARVLDTATPGHIVLMHVGTHPTDGTMLDAEALPRIISGLRDRGYRFVTLPQALSLVG
jgi:peptidoglycan/xylan/chitin deacetylase (PgdA/CDA1 family)